MGKDNLPDFTPDKLPHSRFAQFKDVFFGRLGAMVKINLLSLLFALPLIAVWALTYFAKTVDAGMIPYSGNIGLAYPVVPDAAEIGEIRNLMHNVRMYMMFIPCIVVLFAGLSGAFYVMRRFVWGEGVGVAAHFFRGVKSNIAPFLLSSVFIATLFPFVMVAISSYDRLDIHAAWKIIGLAASVIALVILLCMMIFLTTQAVTYNLKFFPLVRNSFLFSIALLPTNIIMLILSVLPVVLLMFASGIPFLGMIIVMIFILLGLSYIILLWTVYAHWAFDKFVNDRVEGAVKNRGIYRPTEDELKKRAERELMSKNTRFNNPALIGRQIKSIDDGSTYTPLSATFSRADLAKLAEEKQAVKDEIDAEFAELEASAPAKTPQKPAKPAEKGNNDKPPAQKPPSNKSKAKFNVNKKK
jgi:hypothetical protein